MSSQFNNFLQQTRSCTISLNQKVQIHGLIRLIQALDASKPKERKCIVDKLVNLDFCQSFSKIVISKAMILKLTMKITLCFTERSTFRQFYVDILRAHLRACTFLIRTGGTEEMYRDVAVFLEIMDTRFMHRKWTNFTEGPVNHLENLKVIAARALDNCFGTVKSQDVAENWIEICRNIGQGSVFSAMDFRSDSRTFIRNTFFVCLHHHFLQTPQEKELIYLFYVNSMLQQSTFNLKYFLKSGGLTMVFKMPEGTNHFRHLVKRLLLVTIITAVEKRFRPRGSVFKDEKLKLVMSTENLNTNREFLIWLRFVQFHYERSISPQAMFRDILMMMENEVFLVKLDDFNTFCLHKTISVIFRDIPHLNGKFVQKFIVSTRKKVYKWFTKDVTYIKFMRIAMREHRFMERELFEVLKHRQLSISDLQELFQFIPKEFIFKRAIQARKTSNATLNLVRLLTSQGGSVSVVNEMLRFLPDTEEKLIKMESLTYILLDFILKHDLTGTQKEFVRFITAILANFEGTPALRLILVKCSCKILCWKNTFLG